MTHHWNLSVNPTTPSDSEMTTNLLFDLDELNFDNRFVRELPCDPDLRNVPRQVTGACYSKVSPTPVNNPKLVAYSKETAELLDLSTDCCESENFTQIFSGNALAKGMETYATCYGGHQFGNWAGQLGDGRAINLGEIKNQCGNYWTLQLKGAGSTPYSRNADGLAVLRSSIREFLCSEAMYHLGVPTTRALSVMMTGEQVIRDMFYDGNPQLEPGAVVCRVAPSFTRFGHFQIFSARDDLTTLKQLLDFTLRTDFQHLGEPSAETYLNWFAEVCQLTADMIVHWQRVGFVHGVMNTDNMSILGLTIDYGPYGWLENFDLNWTPNTTDAAERRYRYGNQPSIAYWNLAQLANAIYPLINQLEPLKQALNVYKERFASGWQTMMANKLGLKSFTLNSDDALCTELLVLLQEVETDMTLFYRQLAKLSLDTTVSNEHLLSPLMSSFYQPESLTTNYLERLCLWLRQYINRVLSDGVDDEQRRQQMNSSNPKYVLRNYLAQLAIDQAEQGNFSGVTDLLEVLRHPYNEQPNQEKYAEKRPDWARQRAGCSMLSCSS